MSFQSIPGGAPIVVPLTDGATISTDCSLGDIFTVTLGGNRTMANPTGMTPDDDGRRLEYRVKQDGTGNRTLTWGSAFRYCTDVALPTLSTTGNKIDRLLFEYHATDGKWDCLSVARGY